MLTEPLTRLLCRTSSSITIATAVAITGHHATAWDRPLSLFQLGWFQALVAPRLRLVSGVAAAPAGTEYRAHAVRCPHYRARTRAAFSAEVAGPVSGARV